MDFICERIFPMFSSRYVYLRKITIIWKYTWIPLDACKMFTKWSCCPKRDGENSVNYTGSCWRKYARLGRKLRRRHYKSKGSNYIWHLDSYDKLKPYGFCINGCIDGFSRFIVWLRDGRSNNNPKIIARYYIEALASLKRLPYFIRTDLGIENGHIAEMQSYLRRNGPGRNHAFLYGTSLHNQRIESWWGILRRQCAQFWIELFVQMKHDGHFNGDFIDKNILQYVFIDQISVCTLRHYGFFFLSMHDSEVPLQYTFELYEGPSIRYVLKGFLRVRTRYASLILFGHIHYLHIYSLPKF